MSDRELKDTLFVPLSVDVLEDPALNACSMVAQLVYFRGLAHAKRAARDGIVTRRQLVGGLFDTTVVTDETDDDGSGTVEIDAGIGELVRNGLWEAAQERGTYRIVGWLKHNDPVEAVEHRRAERKRSATENAHRSNHKQGYHQEKPNARCPLCKDEFPQVGTHDNAERPQGGDASASPADHDDQRPCDAKETERDIETDSDLDTDLDSNAAAAPRSTQEGTDESSGSSSGRWVEVAEQVIPRLGLDAHSTGAQTVPGSVADAIARGWSAAGLVDLAEIAATKEHPAGWWLTTVRTADPADRDPKAAEVF